MVVDRTGRVDFAVPTIPQPDEVRQLIEKYAFGAINYGISNASLTEVLPLGSSVPDLQLTAVADGGSVTSKQLFSPGDRVVLFIGTCQDCQFREYLVDVQNLAAGDGVRAGGRLIVVFDQGFDMRAVRAVIAANGFPRSTYVSNLRDLFSLSTETRTGRFQRPVLVRLNKLARIASVTTLGGVQ